MGWRTTDRPGGSLADATAAGAPLVEVVDVEKRFGGVRALNGATLTIYEGETLALVGDNGAGKSTLVKALSGVQPPDGGEIRLR